MVTESLEPTDLLNWQQNFENGFKYLYVGFNVSGGFCDNSKSCREQCRFPVRYLSIFHIGCTSEGAGRTDGKFVPDHTSPILVPATRSLGNRVARVRRSHTVCQRERKTLQSGFLV